MTPNSKPVFVVGYPRSGTTITASCIGRHPDIAMPPETQFFFEVAAEETSLDRQRIAELLTESRMRDLELDPEAVLALCPETGCDRRTLFDAILTAYTDKVGKPRAGEKSPMHIHHVPTLLEWYPDARIIYIMRDGRDAVHSIMGVPWTHDSIVRHCISWIKVVRQANDLIQRYPQSIFKINYEALLASPESVLKNVCAFIEAPFDPVMLMPGASAAVPEWEREWKSKAEGSIIPNNGGKWRARPTMDRACMNVLMRDDLRAEGYAPDPVSIPLLAWTRLKTAPYHSSVRPLFRKIKNMISH